MFEAPRFRITLCTSGNECVQEAGAQNPSYATQNSIRVSKPDLEASSVQGELAGSSWARACPQAGKQIIPLRPPRREGVAWSRGSSASISRFGQTPGILMTISGRAAARAA